MGKKQRIGKEKESVVRYHSSLRPFEALIVMIALFHPVSPHTCRLGHAHVDLVGLGGLAVERTLFLH